MLGSANIYGYKRLDIRANIEILETSVRDQPCWRVELSKAKHILSVNSTGCMAAMQLMGSRGFTACALGVISEYSITDLGRMDN